MKTQKCSGIFWTEPCYLNISHSLGTTTVSLFSNFQPDIGHLPGSWRNGGGGDRTRVYFKRLCIPEAEQKWRVKPTWCPLPLILYNTPGGAETIDTNTHGPTDCKLSTIIHGSTSDKWTDTDGYHPHSLLPQLLTSLGSQDGNCPTISKPGCVPGHFLHGSHHSGCPSHKEPPATCGCLWAGCSAPTPAVSLITLNTQNSAAAAQAASKRTLLLIKNLLLKCIKLCNANNPLEIICPSS